MATTYTDIDRLILERWEDTRGLFDAYEELQARIQDVIEEVGERLDHWASDRGYRIDTDAKLPEYYAYKDAWLNRRREEAVICFAISGFAPMGYRKVKDEHPSLWLSTGNLQMLRLKDADREQFARDLRSRLGDQARAWQHQDASPAEYPLGKSLTDISDKGRVQLIADPDRLFEFGVRALEELFPLTEAVDQTLAQFRQRE